MTDYTKLVKALRLCQFGECGCGKCCYNTLKGDWCTEENHPEFFDCDDKMHLDAAAAIEALDSLLDQNTQRCEALRKQLREAHESYEKHLNELESQLPKRGEWIRKDAELYYWHECSKCGERPLYDRYANKVLSAYCPNCGAKMEVQE